MKKKKILKWLLGIIVVIFIALSAASVYFFNVAVVPGKKSFLSKDKQYPKTSIVYQNKAWYKRVKKSNWKMTSASGNYRLDANYISAHSNKTVVILHGYMNNKDRMGEYAAMFHQLGYNVLLPDARAHGQSQGKYIGYGYPERYDVRKWIKLLLKKTGQKQEVAIYGLSMGAATAMMTTGIKLPSQVKAVIEDCGYSGVKDEIEYEAGNLYHLPAFPRFPLVEMLSLINRVKVGYFMGDASSVVALSHNKLPVFFIHGNKDTFVPTRMVYANYAATKGPKELWFTKGAKHAESFEKYPKLYKEKVKAFLNKYMK
ncbi:MAG: alpha/beta hydrolase [Lactobacillus sp.]|nr:alpha/beta hydrolase [Lactobacillus sp.]